MPWLTVLPLWTDVKRTPRRLHYPYRREDSERTRRTSSLGTKIPPRLNKEKEPPQQEHKSNNSERKAFYADSTNNQQQRQKQSKAKTSASAPGRGKAQKMIRQEDIPIHALGHLDKQSVSWLVSQSLNSEVAKKRFENARRLADRDTTHWKDRCRAEYLQELGRYLEVKQAQGYTPTPM